MSVKQTLKFSISQDGTVTEEVIGIKGTQCLDLTEQIEAKLGEVKWRKEKDEYYQTVRVEEEYIEEYSHDSEGC